MQKHSLLLATLLSAGLASACSDSSSPPCADEECKDDKDLAQAEDDSDDDQTSDDDAPLKRDANTPSERKDGGTQQPSKTDSGTPTSQVKGALPCDVQAIVDKGCGSCHGAKPIGAPMSLVTAEDFHSESDEGAAYYELVKQRVNASDKTVMPPSGTNKLTSQELATLNAWLDSKAPAGTDKCVAQPDDNKDNDNGASIDVSGLDCYKFLSHQPNSQEPFKLGVATDAYFNVVFAAPWKGTAYGVVLRPVIDNAAVLHHWLLFEDDTRGTPGGPSKSSGAHPGGQLLHGWAPGGSSINFRGDHAAEDVALELPETTYTVEFHYNSKDPNATDASGVEICVAKEKPKNVAALSWLGSDQLLIPAQKWTGTCVPTAQEPIHILSVTPHMHKTGVRMKGVINRKDGKKEVLHDEAFDFDYQQSYEKDVLLNPGDTITTECEFSQPMTFGESTNAEMCYLFTMAYPKGALADSGLWGGVAHGGSSCLGM